MMSIGTLSAYSVVALCVLILRYRPNGSELNDSVQKEELIKKAAFDFQNDPKNSPTFKDLLHCAFKPAKTCNYASSRIVNWLTGLAG